MVETVDFEQFASQLSSGGAGSALQQLAETLKRNRQFHELFDVRLMQCRHKLGLPLSSDRDLDELPEPMRSQVEEGYLAACREIGTLLLDEGEIRQAWMYLRPTGERDALKSALEQIKPNEEDIDEFVEVALYEGVHVERGFQQVLEHYGTCNAITTFESAMYSRKKAEQQLTAGMLVRWLHNELLTNLRADLDESGQRPSGGDTETIASLVAGRESMFGEYTTHIDASHLSSVVRFARIIEDDETLRFALDLTEYGRRLHENFQQPGESPFQDHYGAHGLFFASQLGQRVEEAIAHFRKEAEAADLEVDATSAVEVYIALLARLGRQEEAIRATIDLVPEGVSLSGFAPSLLDLSRAAGDFGPLAELCQRRGDLLGFAIGRMEAAAADTAAR